jgi:chitinase
MTMSLHERATCRTTAVYAGDTYESLTKACGISLADFAKYNPDLDLRSKPQGGKHVCCCSGQLPSFTRQANADGTCASVVVQPDEWCWALTNANGITVDDLEDFNTKTWGWTGCGDHQAHQRICISKGDPPMPATVDNAVCGPQVPGTKRPTDGTELADLNPCSLKTCCNIWGQCEITEEFCTITKSPTGAPGAATKDKNGCISHCGTDIIKGSAPDKFISIGYFEAWNLERGCLNMDVS